MYIPSEIDTRIFFSSIERAGVDPKPGTLLLDLDTRGSGETYLVEQPDGTSDLDVLAAAHAFLVVEGADQGKLYRYYPECSSEPVGRVSEHGCQATTY